MNKKLLAIFLAGSSSVSFAGPSQFSGPLNTLGNVSTPQTILSATVNPAAGELVVEKSYRWGYMSTVGLSAEVGELDDLEVDLDELTSELDRLEAEADNIGQLVTLSEVEAVQAQFDDFLVELGQKGQLQFGVQARAPIFPIAVRSDWLKGVVTLDAHLTLDVGVGFIDSPLDIVQPTFSDPNFGLSTDTAIDLSAAIVSAFSVGYSHDLRHNSFLGKSALGFMKPSDRLLVGVELSLYDVTMTSQLIAIDQEDENDDLSDVIADEFDVNQVDSTDFGLDLGVLWISDNFQLGGTWKNINEPVFASTALGVNCFAISSAVARRNCEVAATLGANGRIDLMPEYVMESQLSVEGAVTTENKHWSVAGALDINEVAGPLKDAYQWATASVSYFSDSLWIPMARVGYRANLSGSELSYLSGGITLFGGVHVDASMSTNKISVDGDDQPRSFALNVGVERRF